MHALSHLSSDVRQYLLVTGNYWAFTLTDGALRMLVVLHFHALGYHLLPGVSGLSQRLSSFKHSAICTNATSRDGSNQNQFFQV